MGKADASATFAVNLEDGTSGAAESAANALVNLRKSIDADTRALREMQKAMKNLQMGSSVNVQQFRELREKIDAKKASIAQAQSAYIGLGGSFSKTAPKARGLIDRFKELQKAAQTMPGPLGGVVGKLGALRGMIAGGAMAIGLIALGAAMVAVTAASAVAVVALLRYGVAQADARRSELLRLEGLTKIRNWYGLVAGNAGEMQKGIDSVSASSALGRGEISKYSTELYRMGLRGQNLTVALEAMAIKASTQGEEQARRWAGMAAGAALAGRSVATLANDVKARLGGIAAKQMLALNVQTAKLHESFDALFNGLKIEGLLKGLHMVTSLFGQNTITGRALKQLVETIFQPMAGSVESIAPLVKRFFQGIVIGAQMLVIQLLQVRVWFKRAFGDSELLKGIDSARVAVYLGMFAVGAFAGALGAAALAAGALLAVLTYLAAPFLTVVAAAAAVTWALSELYYAWDDLDWGYLGTSMVDGLVSGIKGAASAVLDTVRDLGKGAFKMFKSTLGIASPSKAFAKLGLAISEGVSVGVDRGTGTVNRSVGSMVSIPSQAAEQGASPASAPGARVQSSSVTIESIHIHTSSDKAREIAMDIRRELESVLKGVVISMGAALPGDA